MTLEDKRIEISLAKNKENRAYSLYINNYRVAGPKPWSDCSICAATWKNVPISEIEKALNTFEKRYKIVEIEK